MSLERWLYHAPDGSLIMHVENDGPRFLRRGAEAMEFAISWEQLRQTYPSHYERIVPYALGVAPLNWYPVSTVNLLFMLRLTHKSNPEIETVAAALGLRNG